MDALGFYIKILKHCNLNCDYCYERENLIDSRILSLADIKNILTRVKNYALDKSISQIHLNYTGGEILSMPEEYLTSLFQLSKRIFKESRINVNLNIQTNLTLLNDRHIALLKKFKVFVGTSFDVVGRDRKLKNGKTIEHVMVSKMAMLCENAINFGGIVVITKNNYKKGKDIYDFYKKFSSGFLPIRPHPWAEKFCPNLKISDQEYLKCLKTISSYHLKQKSTFSRVLIIDSYLHLLGKGSKKVPFCFFRKNCLGGNILIENNGDVYPCCTLRHQDLRLGNILQDPLDKILNSPIIKQLNTRSRIIEEECRSCKYISICNGGCMGYSYIEGDIMKPSKSWCEINRAMFEYIEKLLRKRSFVHL